MSKTQLATENHDRQTADAAGPAAHTSGVHGRVTGAEPEPVGSRQRSGSRTTPLAGAVRTLRWWGRSVRPAPTRPDERPLSASRDIARVRVGAVVGTVAVLLGGTVAAASPAQAYQYAQGGATGGSGVNDVKCRYLNQWGVVRAEVAPPVAYASNRTIGWGNDAQYVRYRLFAVDVRTGATVATSGYSGYALARDNVPTTWSGTDQMSVTWRSIYRIETRIEFFNGRTGAFEGWSAHRADKYWYYNGYVTYPTGPMSSCAKL